jgi:Zn ribbon nucleic-acid-binding protein
MNVKKLMTIMGPICGYCIFENDFMEFIIENDVGIACLECGYCFKNL